MSLNGFPSSASGYSLRMTLWAAYKKEATAIRYFSTFLPSDGKPN
jgi:hypothetical protein